VADTVVSFEGVWKKFRRGERLDSLRDLVPSMVKRFTSPQPKSALRDNEFWAVKDVSFEVKRGEALGIIGPNGAGKSTALKLLTRILRPTIGRCAIAGRVGALIEVAAGFHPDLTGRENVYLQGAIMGMRRGDIQRRFDEIVEFSGTGAFIDTPVKRYSSGMQARLGFSIAAHLEPDAFIVDEVLSVGDASFQARCIECMKQQLARGVALVFVSHNLQAVAALCDRAVVLARGQQLFAGDTRLALEEYVKASQTASTRYGVHEPSFELLDIALAAQGGRTLNALEPHTPCRLTMRIRCVKDAANFCFGVELERTRDLLYCYGVTTEELGQPLYSASADDVLTVQIDFVAHFARGHYRANLNVRDPRQAMFLMVSENIASFSVQETRSYDGVVDIEPEIRVTRQSVVAESPYVY
jgi:ABC-type polysaccharide/polyol phosphate transport system ATPase subunit